MLFILRSLEAQNGKASVHYLYYLCDVKKINVKMCFHLTIKHLKLEQDGEKVEALEWLEDKRVKREMQKRIFPNESLLGSCNFLLVLWTFFSFPDVLLYSLSHLTPLGSPYIYLFLFPPPPFFLLSFFVVCLFYFLFFF